MEFKEIAKTNDISPNTAKSFNVDGNEILIVNYNGSYYAVQAKCTHMGGDLSKGKLENNTITCPRHSSKFDITTGKNLEGPKIGPFRGKAKDLRTYEVKVEDDAIMIKLKG